MQRLIEMFKLVKRLSKFSYLRVFSRYVVKVLLQQRADSSEVKVALKSSVGGSFINVNF